jgi:hypothetical protein
MQIDGASVYVFANKSAFCGAQTGAAGLKWKKFAKLAAYNEKVRVSRRYVGLKLRKMTFGSPYRLKNYLGAALSPQKSPSRHVSGTIFQAFPVSYIS